MNLRCITILALAASSVANTQNLRSQVYATGFSHPILMVQDPTNPSVQFVVQQRGLVRVVVNGTVQGTNFLDLTGIVHQTHSEGGLLGLAFHPDYAKNRRFYVNYTDTGGTTRIVRYLRSAGNPLVADAGSAASVISIAQPFSNHNGGTLRFGPNDGFLYIGMGDGGSGNDPGNRAQDITGMLLGKMLRIDVDGDDFPADAAKNYAIPSNNPFVGVTGDDEIWSFGLRNPWKWSFDNPALLGTGGMTIADVGQNAWEEVNYEPPLMGGRNYGWRVWEANQNTGLGGGSPPFVFPIHAYDHGLGVSITGGYVYRGLLLGDYFGRYFFADFGSNRIWSYNLVIDPVTGEGSAIDVQEHTADIAAGTALISSIDVDANGDLYILDYRGSGQGRVIKIMPENRVWATSIVPVFGTPLVGQVRSLSSADTKLLVTRAGIVLTLGQGFRSTFQLNMQTDMVSLSFFDIFIDVGASQNLNPGGLEVRMRNWNTGALDVVGTVPVTTSLETRTIPNVPAANYRRASDGAVQLQFQGWTTAPLLTSSAALRYDRVKVNVR